VSQHGEKAPDDLGVKLRAHSALEVRHLGAKKQNNFSYPQCQKARRVPGWMDKQCQGFLKEIFNGGNISFGKCVEPSFKQPGNFGEVAQEAVEGKELLCLRTIFDAAIAS
jgi:hypothetical protein